ncbi:hypothetical protein ACLQ2R_20500 [Streptosporangium sp. DT93]|uniref:hypothetical protein n=1 Tax=Streptosporangium sp. DT93 TaxID=3393428 RepID=UPI003CE855BB
MTHAEALAELDGLRKTSRIVNRAVWGVAIGVMVYGAGNVTGLLIAHGVHRAIAWMLSPMVDLGLIVALIGGRALDRYGVRAGWLIVLRWTAGLMTWSLNVASPALHPDGVDGVGVLIHSCGPVLLLVVAEASASVQRGIAATTAHLIQQIQAAEQPPPPVPTPIPAPVSAPEPPTLAPAPPPPAPAPAKPRASKSAPATRPRRTATAPVEVEDLMPLGWRIAADLTAAGKALNRDNLAAALREAGESASNGRVGALLARLKTEAPADPVEQAAEAAPAVSAAVPAPADGESR